MRLLLALAVAVVTVACGRSNLLDPGRVAPAPTGPTGPTGPSGCSIVGHRARVRTTLTGYLDPPYVSGRSIYFATADGQLDGIDVVDVDTNTRRRFREERAHRRILDARDGAIAWTETTGNGFDLFYSNEQIEDVVDRGLPIDPRPSGGDLYVERRLVDRHGLLYAVDAVLLWTPETRSEWFGPREASWNATYGARSVAVFGGTMSSRRPIEVYTAGEGLRLQTDGLASAAPSMIVTADHLYFNGSGVFRMSFDEPFPGSSLLSGDCVLADVDEEGRVLGACLSDRGGRFASRVELYADDERFTRDADGALIGLARVDRGLVAYVRYDDEDALCRGNGLGSLRLWDPALDEDIEIAQVAAPCECCDAIAPPFGLAFEDGVLAWNYATAPDSPFTVGYAVLSDVCE